HPPTSTGPRKRFRWGSTRQPSPSPWPRSDARTEGPRTVAPTGGGRPEPVPRVPATAGRRPAGPRPDSPAPWRGGPRTAVGLVWGWRRSFRPGFACWSGRPETRPPRGPPPTGPGNRPAATGESTSCVVPPQHVAFPPAGQNQGRLIALVDLVAQIANVD